MEPPDILPDHLPDTDYIRRVGVSEIIRILGTAVQMLAASPDPVCEALAQKLNLAMSAVGLDYALLLATIYSRAFPARIELRPGLLRSVARYKAILFEMEAQRQAQSKAKPKLPVRPHHPEKLN